MIKIAVLVIISLVLIIILRDVNREFAFILSIAVSVLLFAVIINDLFSIIDKLYSISSNITGLNSYISLMVKVLGISLIAQFIVDLCKDSGENALASQTEITSKILILVIIMPLFESVINVVSGLLK